jgi:hypothetical protein
VRTGGKGKYVVASIASLPATTSEKSMLSGITDDRITSQEQWLNSVAIKRREGKEDDRQIEITINTICLIQFILT